MKVTALIPDKLVAEVRKYSSGKTITESLIVALREWTALQKLRKTSAKIKQQPLSFKEGYSAKKIRNLNRQT